MDIFAHSISGALLGRAVRPEGNNRKSVVIYGALAGISPDIEAPIALLGSDVWYRWHQIFTHSLFGLLWVPLFISLLPWRFSRWKIRYLIALAGWGIHVLLDLCAKWPVPLIWPFSDQKWTFSFLSSDFSLIIDMILLVGLALTFWDPVQKHARWLSIATAAIIAVWFALGLPN